MLVQITKDLGFHILNLDIERLLLAPPFSSEQRQYTLSVVVENLRRNMLRNAKVSL